MLVSTVMGCVSTSAFVSLVAIPVGIASFATGLKICAINSRIRKYKSIVKKKKNKHDKIVFSANAKLNGMEVAICKALINSDIIHNEFVLINNTLKEYGDMKEEIKISNDK